MVKKTTKISVKFCPRCKGEVMMFAGGEVGLYECKKCRFRGSLFPEREIILKNKNKIKKHG